MKKIITLIFFLSLAITSFAETIQLKSNKIIEGKIVEETDEYIKIDNGTGIPITYYLDDIESIKKTDNNRIVKAQKSVNTHYLEYNSEKVRLDIYNPGSDSEKRPVVILIHGAAGIKGDRAVRYRGFAMDLMNEGIIAINVHYFNSKRKNWVNTFMQAINYAQTIPNADEDEIGIVGYSLGGTIALKVASKDDRIKLLAIASGYLPSRFTKENAAKLPKTYMVAGTKDSAINTLYKLRNWFAELGKPFESKINKGFGHTMPMKLFKKNWQTIVVFFTNNFGLTDWTNPELKIKVE